MPQTADDITQLIQRWQSGDAAALDRLLPQVYADLRAMAARRLSVETPMTWQPTALVHDVLLRLLATDTLHIQDRAHLFRVAARVMRNLLIDRARQARTERHGGDRERIDLLDAAQLPIPQDTDLERLDEALDDLESVEPRLARIVELRYFIGLTVQEVAGVLAVDERTVYREWALARVWLREQIET